MNWAANARSEARARRAELGFGVDQDAPAPRIVAAALDAAGLALAERPEPAAPCARYDPDAGAIQLRSGLPGAERAFAIAQMLAAHWFQPGAPAAADLNPAVGDAALADELQKIEASDASAMSAAILYTFAAELLAPLPLLQRLSVAYDWDSARIAADLAIPEQVAISQLSEALLGPSFIDAQGDESAPGEPFALDSLDPSQYAAATVPSGPALVGAGPGTGKTRTLVGRVVHLVGERQVAPSSILALTFSRKAAQEMRERIAAALPFTPKRELPWIGTFHSFGLETLRQYGHRIGLPSDPVLFDTLDCVTLLERQLDRLNLDALSNLRDPAHFLPGIVRAISRAKDELCGPARYVELCEAMAVEAADAADRLQGAPGKVSKAEVEAVEKRVRDAARALEVSRCYLLYDDLLRQQGAMDYADLICLTVKLLEEHGDVAEQLRGRYSHVLGDEYQDVNRATARMLSLLAGPEARGLWVVGDHRQSIYRFRGASPANMAAFARDYPRGIRLDLAVNYRSKPPIVGVSSYFSCAAGFEGDRLADAPAGDVWSAHRRDDGSQAVWVGVAHDEAGQGAQIAAQCGRLARDGEAAYRDIAVLCRSHSQAQAVSGALVEGGIPSLYVGSLLDRDDVRDLLSVATLAAGGPAAMLWRAGVLPRYALTPDLLSEIVRAAEPERGPDVAAEAEEPATMSKPASRSEPLARALEAADDGGARLLAADMENLSALASSPTRLLEAILVGPVGLLHSALARTQTIAAAIQVKLAFRQALCLAAAFEQKSLRAPGRRQNRTLDFLEQIRRMRSLGESPRGAVPDSLASIDAVRVMTVHAAKGLEFPIVFLPYLGKGQFPSHGRDDGIPEPTGLGLDDGSEANEDDCLFFVALSRARDRLVLSRFTGTASGTEVAPSPLLEKVGEWLADQRIEPQEWTGGDTGAGGHPAHDAAWDEVEALLSGSLPVYTATALETYMRCPRQYYYRYVRRLAGADDDGGGAYARFHRCVHETLRWMRDQWSSGAAGLTRERVAERLDLVWRESGPRGETHEAMYRAQAGEMLARAFDAGPGSAAAYKEHTLIAQLDHCRVRIRPDMVLAEGDSVTGETVVLRRHKMAKPGSDDHTDIRLAVMRKAAADHGKPHRIELHYLASGDVREIAPSPRWEPARIAKYDSAAQAVGRKEFQARTGDCCKTCGFVLVCPK